MKFIEPPYEIYTVTGEEHIHLDFFLKIKKYDSVTLKDIIYITHENCHHLNLYSSYYYLLLLLLLLLIFIFIFFGG